MKKLTALLICNSLLFVPIAAQAYIGPGAGLSLLGALWALLLALGTAVVFVLAWPIRRLLRNRRQAQLESDGALAPIDEAADATTTLPKGATQQPRQ